jgi:hypothetical protein
MNPDIGSAPTVTVLGAAAALFFFRPLPVAEAVDAAPAATVDAVAAAV